MARKKTDTGGSTRTKTPIQTGLLGSLLTIFSVFLILVLATSSRSDMTLAAKSSPEELKNLFGPLGAHMADLFLWTMGITAFMLAAILLYIGVKAVMLRPAKITIGPVIWSVLGLLSFATLVDITLRDFTLFGYPPAGKLGIWAGPITENLLSRTGAIIVSSVIFIISMIYLIGSSLGAFLRGFGRVTKVICAQLWRFIKWAGAAIGRSIVKAFTPKPSKATIQPDATIDDDETVLDPVAEEGPWWTKPIPNVLESAKTEVDQPITGSIKIVPPSTSNNAGMELLFDKTEVDEAEPSVQEPKIVIAHQPKPLVEHIEVERTLHYDPPLASIPQPPAFDTAATRSGVAIQLIPERKIGCLIPKNSVIRVLISFPPTQSTISSVPVRQPPDTTNQACFFQTCQLQRTIKVSNLPGVIDRRDGTGTCHAFAYG